MPFDTSGRFVPAAAPVQQAAAQPQQFGTMSPMQKPIMQQTGIVTPSAPPPAPPATPVQSVQPAMPLQPIQGIAQQPMQPMHQPMMQPAMQMPRPQLSLEQSAGRNPQGVQNLLAMNRGNAGHGNSFMNAPGQQGAGPQAGFQGFQTNGMQPQLAANPGSAGVQSNLGYQANQSTMQSNSFTNNAASQGLYGQASAPGATFATTATGGTGGVANDPTQTVQLPPMMKNLQLAISDIHAKENIAPAESELQEFLDALGVYSYEYKDKEHGEGRRVSPMAQEFEQSKLGKQQIITRPDGLKMVNYDGKWAGTQTAATAMINHKLNALEKKFTEAMKTRLSKGKK